MDWPCSGIAINSNSNLANHTVFMVKADNRFEAMGKATIVLEKIFPFDKGWARHHVLVGVVGDVIDDPASAVIVKP